MSDFNISRGAFYRAQHDEAPKEKCFSGLLNCKKVRNNNQVSMESYIKHNVNSDVIDGVHIHAEPVKEAHLMATLNAVDKTMNDIIAERQKEGKNPPIFFIVWDHDKTLIQRTVNGERVLVGIPDEDQQQRIAMRFNEVNKKAHFRCVISSRLGPPERNHDILESLAKYQMLNVLSEVNFFEPDAEKSQGTFPQLFFTLRNRVDDRDMVVPYQQGIILDIDGVNKMPIACNIAGAYCNKNKASEEDIVILFPDDTPLQHEYAEYYITGTPQNITCVSILAAGAADV